jgi:hypothetical protein
MYKLTKYTLLITPVSGAVSWNTDHFHGDLVSIHVKPTTATTQWFFKITDPEGLEIYSSIPVVEGEMNDEEISKAINEICTCALSAATVDEVFRVTIRVREYQNVR